MMLLSSPSLEDSHSKRSLSSLCKIIEGTRKKQVRVLVVILHVFRVIIVLTMNYPVPPSQEAYEECINIEGGVIPVVEIQLCAMAGRPAGGYYSVEERVPLLSSTNIIVEENASHQTG